MHGSMRSHVLNSLIRALCVRYVDRALRMLSILRTLGMHPENEVSWVSLKEVSEKQKAPVMPYKLVVTLKLIMVVQRLLVNTQSSAVMAFCDGYLPR